MSAVLRASLAVRRYRARVVVRHHHDEAGADHHQEGEQIARPPGFHYPPADRHYFRLQAGRGHTDCPVAHGSISFPPRAFRRANGNRGVSKGKPLRPGSRSVRLQPSAFTTKILVEEAAAEAIAEGLSDYRRNFHAASSGAPSGPGGLSSFGPIYLSGGEFEAYEGNKKPFPPQRKKWPTIAERLLTDSPTGPSFSTARRERSDDLSHIRETLNPGIPGPP